MVKVTLNENLVPSRDLWVKGNPYSDLIYNVLLARKLIRVAAHIFQLKKSAVYSGYVNEHEEGFFTITVREQGTPVRSVILSSLGYAGQLNVDVEDLNQGLSFDILGSLTKNPTRHLAISA